MQGSVSVEASGSRAVDSGERRARSQDDLLAAPATTTTTSLGPPPTHHPKRAPSCGHIKPLGQKICAVTVLGTMAKSSSSRLIDSLFAACQSWRFYLKRGGGVADLLSDGFCERPLTAPFIALCPWSPCSRSVASSGLVAGQPRRLRFARQPGAALTDRRRRQ